MSRYYEYDEEAWPNQGLMWEHNLKQALRGKRGRRALTELRAALLALPQPRLIAGALCTVNARAKLEAEDAAYNRAHPQHPNHEPWVIEEVSAAIARDGGEGVCAMGAFLWYKLIQRGLDPVAAFESLPVLYGDGNEDGLADTANLGRDAGLTYVLAWDIAYRNDEEFAGLTPEQRYERFLAWIDRELLLADHLG